MLKSLTFNNIKKPWLYLLQGRSKPPFAPVRRNIVTVPGMPGAHLQSSQTDVMVINQPVGFVEPNDEYALQYKDEIASWLFTNEPVPLEFDDEPGRTYYALVQNTIEDFDKFVKQRQGTIQFLCLDPFSYGPEYQAEFPEDAATLSNFGTADADPIFELEVLKPVTFAMVQNQANEYQMIGRPSEVDEEVVDTKKSILEESGDTLGSWNTSPVQVDQFGIVAGQMTFDGSGIIASNYGSGITYTGPAVIKEVSPAQDFELVANIDTRTDLRAETLRIEIYMFDESMKLLSKIGILDSNSNQHRRIGLGRVGEYDGFGVRYPIYSGNYRHDDFGKSSLFNMRVKRVGKVYEFYIAQVVNGKHQDTLLNSYHDFNEEYLGRLKYVQLYISRHGSHPSPYLARINNIRVFELSQVTTDQTPYIAYTGDIITFDHKEAELLINGEDRKDLKDFGGNYFKLRAGFNQLVIHPEDSFKTSVKYRERFR
ncbi:distal tail protein Dit [Halalkalibacter krulwichiae]|uniref:Phage tail protein n=1 Tax=Halalkalibacter krulwichiae TaxID=199441 RepID=A0A1X9MFD1_9BACI|nr:distal tail protein Dit [Halalkalibacter krulwichiae]ARK32126.1 Phage tail protein [Halalkalibacter krulwichiae]